MKFVFMNRSMRPLAICLLPLAVAVLSACSDSSYGVPDISQHPSDATVFESQSANFVVAFSASYPVTLQWLRDGVAIPGANKASYTTSPLTLADDGAQFSVVISNDDGSVTSNAATLTVRGPPTITTQPAAQTGTVGATATFTVVAAGDLLAYQWRRNDIEISGANSASYTTPALVSADDGASYSVIVGNPAGTVVSDAVTLSVPGVPTIIMQPVGQTAAVGESVFFGVVAVGGSLSYQWHRNGVAIAGATDPIYSISAVALADDAAVFSVTISNSLGAISSADATLAVVTRAATGVPSPVAQVDTSRTVTASQSFTVARKSDGTAWSWGFNGEGQYGNGTAGTAPSDTPVQVTMPSGGIAVELAVGGSHALVLLQGGDVYAWGRNNAGQLGTSDAVARPTPVKVTLPRPAISVAAGRDHSLAALDDGTVYAWGLNNSGQLGNGGRSPLSSPTRVDNLSGVQAVAAGNEHSLALRTDGSVLAWGANAAGQLGIGTFVVSRVPTETVLRNVVRIRAGGDISAAMTATQMLYSWGENGLGQLGRGSATTNDIALPAGIALDVTDVACADSHVLLVGADGSIRGAGENASGEIGDGTTESRFAFTAAISVAGAIAVTGGGKSHSLAVLADGTVLSWGENSAKQLGNPALPSAGTATPTVVPDFDAIP
jgi:alpha-tubulin suppressor-like RCC1 family protein